MWDRNKESLTLFAFSLNYSAFILLLVKEWSQNWKYIKMIYYLKHWLKLIKYWFKPFFLLIFLFFALLCIFLCLSILLFSPPLFFKIMDLAPYISIERCRLVKYDHYSNIMDESFDLDEVGMLIMIWRWNVGGIFIWWFFQKICNW